jgi:hypothetical protein
MLSDEPDAATSLTDAFRLLRPNPRHKGRDEGP